MQKLNHEAGSRCLLYRHDKVTSLANHYTATNDHEVRLNKKNEQNHPLLTSKIHLIPERVFDPSCYLLLGGLLSRDWKIYGPRFEAQGAVFCGILPDWCDGRHHRSSQSGKKSQVVAVLYSCIRLPSIVIAANLMVSDMSQSDESC